MGMFDTFKVDDCDGQVKMFDCVMATYMIGDYIEGDHGNYGDSFLIKLRHGGWVVIVNKMFCEYTDDISRYDNFPKYDKWGYEWDFDSPRYA